MPYSFNPYAGVDVWGSIMEIKDRMYAQAESGDGWDDEDIMQLLGLIAAEDARREEEPLQEDV